MIGYLLNSKSRNNKNEFFLVTYLRMEQNIEGIALLMIIFTTVFSYQGFRDSIFFDKYSFEIDAILIRKEYIRLISSGFLHANWLHLLFNMAAMYSFCFGVGDAFGIQNFLLLYFISLIAGNILALYIHRNHGDYSAIGASGAVNGVIFASIVLFPDAIISFPFLPIEIPSWLFGIGYLLFSLYGIKTQAGNIGHEAHVGGAIAGILTSICLDPSIVQANPILVASLLIPFILFMVLLVKKPEILMIEGYWGFTKRRYRPTTNHDNKIARQEETMDMLLDKVNKTGIASLSKRERKRLDEFSRIIN